MCQATQWAWDLEGELQIEMVQVGRCASVFCLANKFSQGNCWNTLNPYSFVSPSSVMQFWSPTLENLPSTTRARSRLSGGSLYPVNETGVGGGVSRGGVGDTPTPVRGFWGRAPKSSTTIFFRLLVGFPLPFSFGLLFPYPYCIRLLFILGLYVIQVYLYSIYLRIRLLTLE